ncbi:hypothetical protein AS850_01880 [Frondihabitans sp. 762G35]|uniref:hypothetical protein n=1 Tax=Frondihabitans sp. 762G35 TaxID=1446794 RepID=UPI000D200361|nr:hypothetical protein [Frondihabitans sp. 762G35]ARC55827.1 hypothetical protein AS850_01880 [Frondihabitans sp. 762G35]
MTLTDLIPSVRTMIADPLGLDRWPACTASTPADVFVAGVSHVRLAEICGTPCVHTAQAVLPGTHGRPSPTDTVTSVVVTVVSVGRHPAGSLLVTVDADLARVDADLTEARLIGRVSTARDVEALLTNTCVHPDAGTPFSLLGTGLPGDLAAGDLLVFPCRGLVTLHDVRVVDAHR